MSQDALHIEIYLPAFALRPYIECYWMLHAPHGLPPERMPADARTELMFSLAEGSQRAASDGSETCTVRAPSFVLGTRGKGYTFRQLGESHYVAVRFKPGGFAAFTRIPQAQLNDLYVELDCIWGQQAARALEQQLYQAQIGSDQAVLLDQALIRRLIAPDHLSRVFYAADLIAAGDRALSLAKLADMVNLSQKHLERLFARYVGLRPSFYARVARFQRVLTVGLQIRGSGSLTRLALDTGYYDHAHFTREFKTFAGQTPATFFAVDHAYIQNTRH